MTLTGLDELAEFVVSYCDAHAEKDGVAGRRVADLILSADLPNVIARQAVLYGFADEIGATGAAGFDPAWNPVRGRVLPPPATPARRRQANGPTAPQRPLECGCVKPPKRLTAAIRRH